LAAAGIILAACASGAPVAPDGFGNIQPVIQSYDEAGKPRLDIMILQSESSLNPEINPDGSLTLFNFKNFQIKIMPMTVPRSRGALDRTTEEFDNLIAQYTGTVKANPQDYDAYIMLAGLYIDRGGPGDGELAVEYSTKALEISQNNPQALYARGLGYSKLGDSSSALNDLETVLKTNLQSMKGVYYVMGMIYYKDGKIDEAIEVFEKVRTLDPGFVDTDEVLEQLYNLKS
jgi:tetratricopeptide (TPR) repeat protein